MNFPPHYPNFNPHGPYPGMNPHGNQHPQQPSYPPQYPYVCPKCDYHYFDGENPPDICPKCKARLKR